MRVWCMEIVPVKPLEKYNFLALPLLSRYLIWGNTIWRNTIFSFGETKQSASLNHSPKEFLLPRFCVYNDEVFWSETMIKLAIWVTNLTRFLRITRNVPKISPLSWLTPLFPTSQMCHDDRGRQPGRSRLSLSSCQFLMFWTVFLSFWWKDSHQSCKLVGNGSQLAQVIAMPS